MDFKVDMGKRKVAYSKVLWTQETLRKRKACTSECRKLRSERKMRSEWMESIG